MFYIIFYISGKNKLKVNLKMSLNEQNNEILIKNYNKKSKNAFNIRNAK